MMSFVNFNEFYNKYNNYKYEEIRNFIGYYQSINNFRCEKTILKKKIG